MIEGTISNDIAERYIDFIVFAYRRSGLICHKSKFMYLKHGNVYATPWTVKILDFK